MEIFNYFWFYWNEYKWNKFTTSTLLSNYIFKKWFRKIKQIFPYIWWYKLIERRIKENLYKFEINQNEITIEFNIEIASIKSFSFKLPLKENKNNKFIDEWFI